ncbi:MAG TPA: tetratricopeptide repeat protein [Pseudonocardiaceae bacterium]|nr:tetratricopeptide repeat protein [Pseudonocardiaceae bacterium]
MTDLERDDGVAHGAVIIVPRGELPVLPASPVTVSSLPRQAVFVGRDRDLARLADVLRPGLPSNETTIVAVAGLPGVGKTALAIRAAHLAQEAGRFPGGVLFVDLHGYDPEDRRVSPAQALESMLYALGVPSDSIPPDLTGREALYRLCLAELADRGRSVLVVADNASSTDQVIPLLPPTQFHRVIVTSRHSLADLDGARLVDIDVFGLDEAIALLDRVLHVASTDDHRLSLDPAGTVELAELSGYLPLALRIVAALLVSDPDQSVGELVTALSETSGRLRGLEFGDGLAVRAAFDLSYRQLDPGQARMFRLLSLNPGPQVSDDAAAALADLPTAQARRLLSELRRTHLIRPGAARGWWRFHDLLRLYARDCLAAAETTDDQCSATDRLLAHYVRVTRAANQHLDPRIGADQRSSRFATRNDALDWLDAERPNLVAAMNQAWRTDRHAYVLELSQALYWYFDLRKPWIEWITILELAVAACRVLADRAGEALPLNNLGNAYRELRRLDEAVACHLSALEICREVGDRYGEGQALINLGLAHRRLRQLAEAVDDYTQALRICREVGDRYGEGQTLINLGLAYRELRRFDDALDSLRAALVISQEIGDRYGEGKALNNLGRVHQELGQFEEALSCIEQSLPMRVEVGDRYGEGKALINLGGVQSEVGRLADALDSLQAALAICREVGDRYGEGKALGHLGRVHHRQGELAEARRYWQQALVVLREFSDPETTLLADRIRGRLARAGDESASGARS